MRLLDNICGTKVVLRNLELSDAANCCEALTNPETTRYMAVHGAEMTLEIELEWIAKTHVSETDLVMAICIAEQDGTLRHVGNVGIHRIDRTNGHAELGIFLSDRADRGQGIGTDAMRTAIAHAFAPQEVGGLGLLRVWARVYEPNIASRRMAERAGMVQEGVLRAHHLHSIEGPLNEYRFGALACEWTR